VEKVESGQDKERIGQRVDKIGDKEEGSDMLVILFQVDITPYRCYLL
jgi:hypothetical protein